jgi:RES domain-containing protein
MEIYRIALASFSTLTASGKPGRWNSAGSEIIYAAESRSLACLEIIVHTSTLALTDNFKIMVISAPGGSITEISNANLPENWNQTDNNAYELCRKTGDDWAAENKSLILKVPSAIIKGEYNFLINVNHPEFKSVKLKHTEPFFFDPRLKK